MHNGARDWSFWWCDACVTQPIFFTQEEPQKSFLPPHSTSSYISPLFLSYLCLFFFWCPMVVKICLFPKFFKVLKTDIFYSRRATKVLHSIFLTSVYSFWCPIVVKIFLFSKLMCERSKKMHFSSFEVSLAWNLNNPPNVKKKLGNVWDNKTQKEIYQVNKPSKKQ